MNRNFVILSFDLSIGMWLTSHSCKAKCVAEKVMWRSCLLCLLLTSLEGKCSIIIERLKPVEAEEDGAVGGLGPVISNSSFQVDNSK